MLKALAAAFADLFHPKVVWVIVWPLAVSIALWSVLGVWFGDDAVSWFTGMVRDSAVGGWLARWVNVEALTSGLGWLLLVGLAIPLVIVTASVIVGVFSMPALVTHVAGRDFPALERRRGGSFVGGVANAVVAIAVFALLGLVSLPLWLFPVLWPVLAALLVGYLNQRMFRYDALAEHASAAELREIVRDNRAALFGLGAVVSLLSYVPFAGLIVPVLAGLAFIHYCLARLEGRRRGATTP